MNWNFCDRTKDATGIPAAAAAVPVIAPVVPTKAAAKVAATPSAAAKAKATTCIKVITAAAKRASWCCANARDKPDYTSVNAGQNACKAAASRCQAKTKLFLKKFCEAVGRF